MRLTKSTPMLWAMPSFSSRTAVSSAVMACAMGSAAWGTATVWAASSAAALAAWATWVRMPAFCRANSVLVAARFLANSMLAVAAPGKACMASASPPMALASSLPKLALGASVSPSKNSRRDLFRPRNFSAAALAVLAASIWACNCKSAMLDCAPATLLESDLRLSLKVLRLSLAVWVAAFKSSCA